MLMHDLSLWQQLLLVTLQCPCNASDSCQKINFETGHTILQQHMTANWNPFYDCLFALSSKADKH